MKSSDYGTDCYFQNGSQENKDMIKKERNERHQNENKSECKKKAKYEPLGVGPY